MKDRPAPSSRKQTAANTSRVLKAMQSSQRPHLRKTPEHIQQIQADQILGGGSAGSSRRGVGVSDLSEKSVTCSTPVNRELFNRQKGMPAEIRQQLPGQQGHDSGELESVGT